MCYIYARMCKAVFETWQRLGNETVTVHLLQGGQESTFRGLGENRTAESPSLGAGIRLFDPQLAPQVLRPLNSGAYIMFSPLTLPATYCRASKIRNLGSQFSTIRKRSHLPSPPLSFLYLCCSSGENIYLHREHYVVR